MTQRAALAATLGLTTQELAEYRYQPGKNRNLFAIGDDYFAVSPTPPTDDVGASWKEHPDQFWAKQAGTVVWVATIP